MRKRLKNTGAAMSEQDEKALYDKAKKRAKFKVHVMIFILANLILWLIYSFGFKLFREEVKSAAFQFILFVSLVWGVVAIAHYLIVYKWGKTHVDKEFHKLKEDHSRSQKEQEEGSIDSFNS